MPPPVRFVTAAALFDGHDAAIHIMRRILQAQGAEVVHLGHDRSALDVVRTAIEEDADGIAVSSYQGGHVEYFKYVVDLLRERGAGHVRVYGGGGGTIVPAEIAELHAYGVARIFSPEDGMRLGLDGMIALMIAECREARKEATETGDWGLAERADGVAAVAAEPRTVARAMTAAERRAATSGDGAPRLVAQTPGSRLPNPARAPVLGITGTGGAGKSTLTDELLRRFLADFPDVRVAVLSVDPTRASTGGALLGDRIRMNALSGEHGARAYMRSFATRQAHRATSESLREAVDVAQDAGFDLVVVETAGIGQSDTEIGGLADVSLYVMTAEFGAPSQLEKIGMLDTADLVALNKFEKRGSLDALRDVRKQVQRNRQAFSEPPDAMPVYPTMAARFNDPGVSRLYLALLDALRPHGFSRTSALYDAASLPAPDPAAGVLVPPRRQRYLAEIADAARAYRAETDRLAHAARDWDAATETARMLADAGEPADAVQRLADAAWSALDADAQRAVGEWDALAEAYSGDEFVYQVRGKDVRQPLRRETLSGLKVPRVAVPRTESAADRLRFVRQENVPGAFPFTAGVFPLKREGEDPTRMFAGEGSPERTNRRFHLVSRGLPAKRLSTAFDSVTLYGRDPGDAPDVYGKVGTSGVSVASLDDMKKLYSGFDLCAPTTSVSMTINGPAPAILAMFLNTAVDQQAEAFLKREGRWDTAQAVIADRVPNRPVYVPYRPEGTPNPELRTPNIEPRDLPDGHDGAGLGLLGCTSADLVRWNVLTEAEYAAVRDGALRAVRGTVQADILKEDQAQNTCIFSTEFSLRVMGDIQQSFVDRSVRNFYSVSISGYHIAEAGANPVSQLAFTLANGFTYVETYLARGMAVDDFAPNLSFFFSNGMDAEYAVLGRVARRIWAVAMRDLYHAGSRSQQLKYHVQTSGRSLHAQEIQFNDIRTTLQALLALQDNANSLHTNAYDEAITTPTEESVRRALAIQLILNREFGVLMNENPAQGAYLTEWLTDAVEDAVLAEFERISDRGGVLGAMETMYQRGKIQEESMLYEHRKHSGELPVVGVNTFRAPEGGEPPAEVELMRGTDAEKRRQIENVAAFQSRNAAAAGAALAALQQTARDGGNVFEALLETVRVASLGQITAALFEVGGQYRRSM